MSKFYIREPFIVKAHQLDKEIMIPTISGVVIGKVGDYLITYKNGMKNICNKEMFESNYEEYEPSESVKKEFH